MTAAPLIPLQPEVSSRLAEFSLFEDIRHDSAALHALREIMTERAFQPSETIVQEGATGSEMYLLIQGKVGVYKSTPAGDEYKVAELLDAHNVFFGEGSLIDSDMRSATIRAETACKCFVLESTQFHKFSARHPEWALPIFKRIARVVMARLRKTSNDLLLLYNALVAEIRGR